MMSTGGYKLQLPKCGMASMGGQEEGSTPLLSSLHNIETSGSVPATKEQAREYATKIEAAKINPQM
jgi:hypothetical protein